MSIISNKSTVLDIPPSATAFCPSHPEFYVVGTYFLHRNEDGQEPSDGPQKRTGTLILYRLEGTEFTHVQTLNLDSAVLDIEWTPHTSSLGDICCVATSTGSLEFFSLDANAEKLQSTSKHQICDENTLVLDLLWHPTKPDIIAVTLSDGAVSLCQSNEGTHHWSSNSKITVTELATHSLEPWTLAFSPDASRLFSGGDDAVLQSVQLSLDSDDADSQPVSTPLWTDRKSHQAGVTAILPLASDLLITGSYDDNIRLLYAPSVGRKQVLAELNLGGGVWRLKMLDDDSSRSTVSREADGSNGPNSPSSSSITSHTLLASCMHAGSRIVRLSRCRSSEEEQERGAGGSDEWEFSVLARFEEHESMNYGSDVQPVLVGGASVSGSGEGGASGGERTVVSTSFYDRLMCVWRVKGF